MNLVDTEYLKYFWPMRTYLITCGDGSRANIIAVSFCMPISRKPPMIGCAIGRSMFSSELLMDSGELVVNVPERGLSKEIQYCGYHSGRDVDKFSETGLTPMPSRHLSVPAIAECAAHMECLVQESLTAGDKYFFAARVVDAYADERIELGEREPDWADGEFPDHVYGTRFGSAGKDGADCE